MTTFLKAAKHRIKHHSVTIREDDIFFVSYPRSGNTWVRFLLGGLLARQRVDFLNVESVVPDIYLHSNRWLKKVPSPRLIKSHETFNPRYKQVVYIVRDVRDVVVSYYSWCRKMKHYKHDLDTFVTDFVNGDLDDFGNWGCHVNSWVNNSALLDKFILIHYEDLLGNTQLELLKVVEHLGIDRSIDEINGAILNASFENMKELEAMQSSQDQRLRKSNNDIRFIRKGVSGQWRDVLSNQHVETLERRFGHMMSDLGYGLRV